MFRLTTYPTLRSTLRVPQTPMIRQARLYRTKPQLQNTTTEHTCTSEQRLQLLTKHIKESFAVSGKQACYDGLFDVWLLASLNKASKNGPGNSAGGIFSRHYPRVSVNDGK